MVLFPLCQFPAFPPLNHVRSCVWYTYYNRDFWKAAMGASQLKHLSALTRPADKQGPIDRPWYYGVEFSSLLYTFLEHYVERVCVCMGHSTYEDSPFQAMLNADVSHYLHNILKSGYFHSTFKAHLSESIHIQPLKKRVLWIFACYDCRKENGHDTRVSPLSSHALKNLQYSFVHGHYIERFPF